MKKVVPKHTLETQHWMHDSEKYENNIYIHKYKQKINK